MPNVVYPVGQGDELTCTSIMLMSIFSWGDYTAQIALLEYNSNQLNLFTVRARLELTS